MKLITAEIKKGFERNMKLPEAERMPILKLFNPMGAATWLISEMDEDGILFGLCDLGMGFPELGNVSLEELESVQLPFGLKIERDRYFSPTQNLAWYTDEARKAQAIIA